MPAAGPEVDDVIRLRHEFLVVLDHEERVALRPQRLERFNQAVVVPACSPMLGSSST